MRINEKAKKELEALRKEFPKCDKRVYSICMRTEETGACFCQRAEEIRAGFRKPEKRKKAFRFSARLTAADAALIYHEMARRGLESKQDLVEALLIEWARWSEKEPLPVDRPGNGSEDGADAEASPSSKDNTKKEEMQ